MGFYTVRADLSVAKRVARFFFYFYNVIQIFLTICIMSNYQVNMKNIISFYFSIHLPLNLPIYKQGYPYFLKILYRPSLYFLLFLPFLRLKQPIYCQMQYPNVQKFLHNVRTYKPYLLLQLP